MLALYLGLITLAESFRHALQQLRADAVWVALVAGGLGLQTGLYLRVRQIVKGRSAGGQARTGAGTGTSTAGMVACCAHHLTDLSGCARTQAAPAPASSISQPSAAAAAVSTDSQNGIDVKVTLDPSGLARAGGTLRFSFGLDNHSVDLINLDLAAKAVLRPTPGEAVTTGFRWEQEGAGHHATGVLSLPNMDANGRRIVTAETKSLTLEIRDLGGAALRSFRFENAGWRVAG